MIPRETLFKAAEALRKEFRTLSAAYLIEDAAAENDDKSREVTPWMLLAEVAIVEAVAQEREKLLSLLERRAADYRAGRLWTNGQGALAELDWLVAALRRKELGE